MTECKVEITPDDLAAMRLVLAASERSRDNTPAWHRFKELVESIEEQVKPAVEEPTEWGSVVRARRVGYGSEDTTTLRWQRHNKLGDAWISEPAGDLGIVYHSDWMYLVDPEVLRVGIREPGVDRDAAYAIGREDFAYDIRKQLTDLRSTIITGPEKRIADAALALVAALLGES